MELIDRAELLKHKTLIPGFVGEYVSVQNINALQTVQPEVRRGKWCKRENRWFCSECNLNVMPCDPFSTPNTEGYNFCPNCGADMREEPPKEVACD